MHRYQCLICTLLLLSPISRGQDWPEFRGPYGNGHAAADDAKPAGLPLRWSETENVKWKTPIPYSGWSTPVVMGGQVWLTTATEDGHDFFVLCLDANTGRIEFNGKLFHCDNPEPLGNSVNCYAAPSPVIEPGRYSGETTVTAGMLRNAAPSSAIEPGRVYLHFGCYGTACADTTTRKTIWARNDLPCRHFRGPGSSPILFGDLLILSMDGIDVQYLVALDKKTGHTVWKTNRTTQWDDLEADGTPKMQGDYHKSFSTPLILDLNGKPVMISLGSKQAYAYDPRTGGEIWKVWHGSHTAAPRPVFGGGLVLFATGLGKPEVWAVKPDGQGDVSRSHVVWKSDKAVPKTASPVVVGDLLFMVSDDGMASCTEIATGNQLWKKALGGRFAASPIHADGRLYFCNQKGITTVIKPGRTCEVLATNTLENGCMASPAVAGKALFLRTKTHLYRIEDKGQEAK